MKFQSSPRWLTMAAITLSAIAALPAVGQVINEDAKLLPNDGAERDEFGYSVAISGTTAVIGARRDDDNGNNSGSAYLFDTTTGQQIAKLLPNDDSGHLDFGISVAISNSTAVVGCVYHIDNKIERGSAYLFDAITGQEIAKLLPNDITVEDGFGRSVAISNTTIVVGAFHDDNNGSQSGAAYLFDTTTGQQIAKLLPNDGAAYDQFGYSVAISGSTAVVGAWANDDNGNVSGSAYLFDTTTGQQIAKLLPNDGAEAGAFGWSVAICGTTVVVGAPGEGADDDQSGSAYLFDLITGQQIAKLLPSDGGAIDFFGNSVSISGPKVVVGADRHDATGSNSGSAYLFDATTGQQIAKILPNDNAAYDAFGLSVAISGNTIVVGTPGDSYNGVRSGSAYVFNAAPCPADLTGDGTLDFFDVSAFLVAYQNQDPNADFNADGVFNFFDVSAFLTAYLAGCP